MKRREFITPLRGAASKTNATKQKEEAPNKDTPETPPDSPPIDFWDDAVKRLIRGAKKRGYVTHDQINALLSSEQVKHEQIENILAKLNEMGIELPAKVFHRTPAPAADRPKSTRQVRVPSARELATPERAK